MHGNYCDVTLFIVTAWEGLREQWAYRPKKRPKESEYTWRRRCNIDGEDSPTHLPIEAYLARKWGLQRLLDPTQPYNPEGGFQVVRGEYPCHVVTLEHLLDFIVDAEVSENISSQVVSCRYGMVAFDMTKPIHEQLKKATALLLRWQEKLEGAGSIVVEDGRGKTLKKFKEHLRVLDALRATPSTTYVEIGRIIGKAKPWQDAHKKGKRLADAAVAASQNYQEVLTATPPAKKDNS